MNDAHFLDFLRTQLARPGAKLAYFAGYTQAEEAARSARHTLVSQPMDGSAHVVTAANFTELFEQIVVRDGRVGAAPGVLASLPPGVVLHIATPLAAAQWDAIRNHAQPLALSIAPTAQPPAGATRLPAAAPVPAPTPVDLRQWKPAAGLTTVLHTADAHATVHAICARVPQAMLVDVGTDLQSDELLRALRKDAGVYTFATRPMTTHLQRGGLVILRGLESHPDLQQGLAAQLLSHFDTGSVLVVANSKTEGSLLQQVPTQCVDSAELWPHAERIAQALARPGLHAAMVTALRDFARTVDAQFPGDQVLTAEPSTRGFAFISKLAAYHEARGGAATPQSWGHSLADLLRHECGADALRTAHITERAQAQFGPAPQSASHTPAERQAACVRILRQHRALFLQGPPGAGKSFQAQAVAAVLGVTPDRLHTLSVGPATTRAELLGRDLVRGDTLAFEDGPLATWARDNRPGVKLLVVDEANLPRPGFWQFLCTAFHTRPALLVNGESVPLSQDHKIIFTGNDDHVVGRFVHQEMRDWFIAQHFAAYSPAFLREQIILPSLQRLAPGLPAAQAAHLADQALDLHLALGALPGAAALSPRNLEEAVVRALSHSETPAAHALGQAYAGMLTPRERAGLHAWQEIDRGAPRLPAANTPGPNTHGIVWTRSTCELASAVDAFLKTRAWRLAHGHSGVGQVGLLVEGPSGRGKDEVVAQRLQEHGVAHQVINAGMDYTAFSAAIQAAAPGPARWWCSAR